MPKAIRTRLHLKVGVRLRFLVDVDGSVRLAAATRDLATLRDILPRPKRRTTFEELDAVIRRHAARRQKQGVN